MLPTQPGAPAADQPVEPREYFAGLIARMETAATQNELKERRAMIKAARAYYDGNHPASLKARPGEPDPNVVINLCRRLINDTTAWLFGDPDHGAMLRMELREGEQETEGAGADVAADEEPPAQDEQAQVLAQAQAVNPAQDWLDRVWAANGGPRLLQRAGRRGGITGHGAVKILPVDDPSNELDVPRLILLKQESFHVIRREDDDDTAEAYVIEWTENRRQGERRVEVPMRQVFGRVDGDWYVAVFAKTGRGREKWLLEQGPDKWPYGWAPVVEWQNLVNDNGYFGLSELEDLTTINSAINFTVTNVNRILYIHGHPRTIGTGFEAAEVQDTAIDSFWTIANKDAKIQNLEMQTDLNAAAWFLQFLTQQFGNIGRYLDLASLTDKIGQVTNFGLQVLALAAVQKLGEKRANYGDALNRINRILLELGNFPPQDTTLHWRNPLPQDITAMVDALVKEIDAKITSRRTAAEERGRDWPTEQDRIADEQAGDSNVGELVLRDFMRGNGGRALRAPRAPASPAAAVAPTDQVAEA